MQVTGFSGTTPQGEKLKFHNTKKVEKGMASERPEWNMLDKLKHGMRAFEQSTISAIKDILGEAAKQLGVTDLSTYDTSPEATAQRIADFAIGMYAIYKKQHPEMEEVERLEKYEKLIRGAVDKGFREAITILQGLSAMTTKVEQGINKTYELVHSKLTDFFTSAKEASQQHAIMIVEA